MIIFIHTMLVSGYSHIGSLAPVVFSLDRPTGSHESKPLYAFLPNQVLVLLALLNLARSYKILP